MKRRDFLKVSAAGAAATAVASPAIAQSSPEIKWRLTSSFPKSLDTIYGGAEQVSKYVAEMTDNKFQIQPFAAGSVTGVFETLDAVTAVCGRDVGQRDVLGAIDSHHAEQVSAVCERVIWLEQGAVRATGPAEEVLDAYAQAHG